MPMPSNIPRGRGAFSTAVAAGAIAALTLTCMPGARAAGAAAAAPSRCSTSQLVIWIDLPGSGTAGSFYYSLQFTNLGARPCTLRGYPGISAIDLAGHQLGAGAGRNTLQGLATVTLGRGATKTAVLRVTDTGALPPAECRETTAAGIRVYPPGQTTARIVSFPFRACSRRGRSNITTSAVGRFRENE
jgi:hypothetical protein